MKYKLDNKAPDIHESSFVAPSADLIGSVLVLTRAVEPEAEPPGPPSEAI